MTDDGQHPMGADWETRVGTWQARATFGDPSDPMTEVARMVVAAASATTEGEVQRLSARALGLFGHRTTSDNLAALRDALQDFARIAEHAFPMPDPETGETPDAQAPHANLLEVQSEGAASWLYRRVHGRAYADRKTHRQTLRRLVALDPGLRSLLEWALWVAPTPNQSPSDGTGSRGRVR